MQRALWFLVSMATLAVPMAAAHREGLKTGLQEALSLAESGRFDQANTVLRRVSGCDMAPDAVPVDSIWKDAPARGIRKVLELVERGSWILADDLTRHLSGCSSYLLSSRFRRFGDRPDLETMQQKFPPRCQALLAECLNSDRERKYGVEDYFVKAKHCGHIAIARSFEGKCGTKDDD